MATLSSKIEDVAAAISTNEAVKTISRRRHDVRLCANMLSR